MYYSVMQTSDEATQHPHQPFPSCIMAVILWILTATLAAIQSFVSETYWQSSFASCG
jgi:hypothetical protein